MTESLAAVKEFRLKLYVSDLSEHRRFYEEKIRWPIIRVWDRGVMYDAGSAIFELLEHSSAELHSPSCDVSLEVSDVQAL